MIKAKPLALAQKLKNIVDIFEAAETEIEAQKLIQKGALDAGKENDGIEPAVVRKIIARRKKIAKDPAETTRLEDLMTDYQFMLGEGREDTRPWTQADDEVSRVMALTNTSKPPKIEAIKKALGCSQGKAHKLRSIAAVRLAKKSSSSFADNEHEHFPKPEDGDDGITGGKDERSDQVSIAAEDHQGSGEGSRSGLAGGPVAEAEDGRGADGSAQADERDVQASQPVVVSLSIDEAPAPRSVGAVAAEPRVAPPFLGDDPGPIPDFLRGSRTAQGRGA